MGDVEMLVLTGVLSAVFFSVLAPSALCRVSSAVLVECSEVWLELELGAAVGRRPDCFHAGPRTCTKYGAGGRSLRAASDICTAEGQCSPAEGHYLVRIISKPCRQALSLSLPRRPGTRPSASDNRQPGTASSHISGAACTEYAPQCATYTC